MANVRKTLVKPSSSTNEPDLSRVEAAVKELLEALDQELKGDLEKTPKRVAKLWAEHLLVGEQHSPEEILSASLMDSTTQTPVCVTNLGTYLTCPHHLTVAFGNTHIAYEPNEKLVGFGALADLVRAHTARLTFQEDATDAIADTLQEALNPKAVVVMMMATHPCHTLNHPRAHESKIITWATRGPQAQTASLKQLLQITLEASE